MEKFCAEKKNDTTNGVHGSVAGSNSEMKELIEKWQCYKHDYVEKVVKEHDEDYDEEYDKDVKDAGGLCILENQKKNEKGKEKKSEPEPEQFQKTFNDFFYFWIRRFLNDSMYWRGKIGGKKR